MRVVTPPMSSSFNSWGLNRNASSAEDDDSVRVDEDDQKIEISNERRVESRFDNHRLLTQREPCPAEHSNTSSGDREGLGWFEMQTMPESPLARLPVSSPSAVAQRPEGAGIHLSQSFLPYSGVGGNNDSLPGEEDFPVASSSAATSFHLPSGFTSPRRESFSLSTGGSMLPLATRRLLEQNNFVPAFNSDQQLAAQTQHRRGLIPSSGAYSSTSGAALLGVIDANNFSNAGAATNHNPYFSQAIGSTFHPSSFVASAYSAAGVAGLSSGVMLRGGGVAFPASLDFGTSDGLSPYGQAAQSLPPHHHSGNANMMQHHLINHAQVGGTTSYGIGVALPDMSTSLFPIGTNATTFSNSPLLLSPGGVRIGSLLSPIQQPLVDIRTGMPENTTNHPFAHGVATLKSADDDDPLEQPVPGTVEFAVSPEAEVGTRSEDNTASSTPPNSTHPQNRASMDGIVCRDEVKPKRPLSAYNLFFKDRRLELIAKREREAAAALAADPSCMAHPEDEDVRPTRKRRRSNKTKKVKIGFEEMAQIISAQWKQVDSETLAAYQRKAEEDKRRYEAEMEDYRQRQRQGLEENQRALESSVDPETRMRYLATFGSKDDSL